MNGCVYRQNSLVGCVGNMDRGADSDGVVCPKPRRDGLPLQLDEPIRSSSRLLHIKNEQSEASDAKAGRELLDTILMKGSYGYARSNFPVASSPPFFSGSPPTRTSNPVIQDEQFGNGNFNPLSTAFEASPPPPSSARKSGGCVRVSFGHKPATVRIEGFNCRGNCSISAVA
ncbi:Hypothetical predicted protein [Olea europaea subsp. europaea]|uniref:Uncharacterized protein n=1 Tax=Olea europaea subsp. europaea TaxID=158383 RepID=A0A8S0S149_OLEEU|nr:Hypothetical predicted protein [Olea europaea subsp. europaea]